MCTLCLTLKTKQLHSFLGFNLGFHACQASAFPAEPAPHPGYGGFVFLISSIWKRETKTLLWSGPYTTAGGVTTMYFLISFFQDQNSVPHFWSFHALQCLCDQGVWGFHQKPKKHHIQRLWGVGRAIVLFPSGSISKRKVMRCQDLQLWLPWGESYR